MTRVGGGERCSVCGRLVAYGELHWTDDAKHAALRLVAEFEQEAADAQGFMEATVLRTCARRLREAVR